MMPPPEVHCGPQPSALLRPHLDRDLPVQPPHSPQRWASRMPSSCTSRATAAWIAPASHCTRAASHLANRLQRSLPNVDFYVHPDPPFSPIRERRLCFFLDELAESLDDLVPLVGDAVEVLTCLNEALRPYLPDLFAALAAAAKEAGGRENV